MPSGGKRRGAGRPAKPVKIVRKVLAEGILAAIDEKAIWVTLLKSKDERIRLDTLKYLTDRRDGRAPQGVNFTEETTIRIMPAEYVAAVNRALGFTGRLVPLESPVEKENGALPFLPE